MKALGILFFSLLFTLSVKGQTLISESSLIGSWELDSAVYDKKNRDTLTFRFFDETFVPLGTEFFEGGKYQTMTVWAWCGTRSTWEKIFGLNKSKYRKGKWRISTENDRIYLTMKDRKIGIRRFEVLERKAGTMALLIRP